jgi:hypothetical protein
LPILENVFHSRQNIAEAERIIRIGTTLFAYKKEKMMDEF